MRDEPFQHLIGLEAVEAILEVDVVRRERELRADARPERLVLGKRRRREMRDRPEQLGPEPGRDAVAGVGHGQPHPLVGRKQRAFLKRAALRGAGIVVLDIPLLFEGRGERRVDAVLVVSAPSFLQRRRVLARPGMTEEKFAGILRQQVPDSLKRRKASVVIPTGLGLAPTRDALERAVRRLKQRPGRSWPPNPWREKFTAQLARARRK